MRQIGFISTSPKSDMPILYAWYLRRRRNSVIVIDTKDDLQTARALRRYRGDDRRFMPQTLGALREMSRLDSPWMRGPAVDLSGFDIIEADNAGDLGSAEDQTSLSRAYAMIRNQVDPYEVAIFDFDYPIRPHAHVMARNFCDSLVMSFDIARDDPEMIDRLADLIPVFNETHQKFGRSIIDGFSVVLRREVRPGRIDSKGKAVIEQVKQRHGIVEQFHDRIEMHQAIRDGDLPWSVIAQRSGFRLLSELEHLHVRL